MQKFRVEVLVTVNTADGVSEDNVTEAMDELLSEFDGGTVEIQTCQEL